MASKKKRSKSAAAKSVYVVDGWDDDAQDSYVKVFSTRAKAAADLKAWRARYPTHDIYAGVVKRPVL